MKNFRKLKKWILPSILVMVGGLTPFIAAADPITEKLLSFVANILYFLMVIVPGQIMNLVLWTLTKILSYSDFAHESVITIGWSVLRDVGNMFFIAILLTIAIGTILKSSRYGYQQNLRRLIIMAILINFSKTIVLFFIDLSQAVTIAFVNAFINDLQAGYLRLLGLTQVANFGPNPQNNWFTEKLDDVTVLFRIVLAGIMIIIATLVIAVITFIFALRIIYFAFIIVLAPLAFVASTMPTAKKYYDEWWDIFGKYLVVGPVLAFFLWFAFTMVSQQNYIGFNSDEVGEKLYTGTDTAPDIIPKDKASSTGPDESLADVLKRYFIGITLLMGALTMADKLGVAGASMGRAVSGKIKGAGKRVMVGKSGAGGVLGLARAGAGVPVGVVMKGVKLADKGISSTATKGVQRFYGTALGQKMGGTEGRAARITAGTGRVVKGFVGVSTGVKAYTAAGRAYQGMERGAKQKNVKAYADEARDADLETLRAGMNGFDKDKATAYAQELQRKGGLEVDSNLKKGTPEYIAQKKVRDGEKRKALALLKAGGVSTEEQYKDLRRSNLHLIDDDNERESEVRAMNNEGVMSKYLSRQDFGDEKNGKKVMNSLIAAGVTKKQIESSSTNMTSDQRGDLGEAIAGHAEDIHPELQTAKANLSAAVAAGAAADKLAELTKAVDDLEKKMKDARELGVAVNPKQASRYATDLNDPANGGRMSGVKLDPDSVRQLASKITGERIKDLDDGSLKAFAFDFSQSQYTSLAKLGSKEQMQQVVAELKNIASLTNTKTSFGEKARANDKLTWMASQDSYADVVKP